MSVDTCESFNALCCDFSPTAASSSHCRLDTSLERKIGGSRETEATQTPRCEVIIPHHVSVLDSTQHYRMLWGPGIKRPCQQKNNLLTRTPPVETSQFSELLHHRAAQKYINRLRQLTDPPTHTPTHPPARPPAHNSPPTTARPQQTDE